jgi:uncharacterized protein (TIGR03435 family)
MTRFVALVFVWGSTIVAYAQGQDELPPARFEVASVKPNLAPQGVPILGVPTRGAVTAVRQPAESLIFFAYNLENRYQIVGGAFSGGPKWLWEERFDIRALPPENVPRDQIPRMMQSLLAERFKLRVHWETRNQPVFALVLARTDRRLGPDLRLSKHDCAQFAAGGGNAWDAEAPRDEAGRALCLWGYSRVGVSRFGGAPISRFVDWLERNAELDRPVVDQTGLIGNFDIAIEFAQQRILDIMNRARGLDPSKQQETAPDIFRAVEEQLGLKLEPKTAPAKVLVIDSVERPDPD